MENNRNILIFILMLILVPLAGEPKFHPFPGDISVFRVSFGSPVFLLFLLWLRNTPAILSGILTGLSVTFFRFMIDLCLHDIDFYSSFIMHAPVFFYYLTFAICFRIPQASTLYRKSLEIAGWSIFAEFVASLVELFITAQLLSESFNISTEIVLELIFIATIRCFFILSFFYLSQLYHIEIRANYESSQKRHILLMISNLYEEVIQLSKSQQNAELVTRDCYKLYEKLQDTTQEHNLQKLSSELLSIAGQVHDIKKDNQRIYVGLRQLTANRRFDDYMPVSELSDIIISSNKKYAKALDKTILFSCTVEPTLPCLHAYTILSLVNNLTANAVEAIKHQGMINISFSHIDNNIKIKVTNSGKGIPERKLPLLFNVGYTTKFDKNGTPSSGVGLPYVKHLTEQLGGNISVDITIKNETTFILSIPLTNLKG